MKKIRVKLIFASGEYLQTWQEIIFLGFKQKYFDRRLETKNFRIQLKSF
ncbi:MAG: hypothetical protein K5766_04955 [Alphaproteobacteria bacterium]|nr:hypothetical protein [Alphaproteobacteria bacterium]MCR4556130.1 hypothetical protein [Alphaproteobacteria bacterium]